jgi:hypothetical protein
MKHRIAALVVCVLIFTFGCGGGSAPGPNPPPKQLDPNGNWEFVLSSTQTADTFTWGADLYELNPPNMTSNSFPGWYGANGFLAAPSTVNLGFTGAVSGTATVTFNSTVDSGPGSGLVLTGTIATDQQHMSGTWSQPVANMNDLGASGSWTAQLLTPVTGTWTGTLTPSDNSANAAVTLTLTEDTSQTAGLGSVTGTIATSTATCAGSTASFNVSSTNGQHQGQWLQLYSDALANGTIARLNSTPDGVNTAGTTIALMPNWPSFTLTGGPCGSSGVSYTGTLTKQ